MNDRDNGVPVEEAEFNPPEGYNRAEAGFFCVDESSVAVIVPHTKLEDANTKEAIEKLRQDFTNEQVDHTKLPIRLIYFTQLTRRLYIDLVNLLTDLEISQGKDWIVT